MKSHEITACLLLSLRLAGVVRLSRSVHLLAVLVFLLLEFPEMVLDGRGGLLNFNRAERRNSRHCACPVTGIGVLSIHAYAVSPEAIILICFAAPPAERH